MPEEGRACCAAVGIGVELAFVGVTRCVGVGESPVFRVLAVGVATNGWRLSVDEAGVAVGISSAGTVDPEGFVWRVGLGFRI